MRIIIGPAGMSGLAAGIRLAHFGKRVCILERHSAIGGLNSFYRQRGRTYDVGLHALTNYTPKGTRTRPLGPAAAAASPGLGGMGPGAPAWLGHRVSGRHAAILQQFRTLRGRSATPLSPRGRQPPPLGGELRDYDQFGEAGGIRSARQVLGEIIGEPLLVEMILCPILYYGSSREHDIDFDQFSILFRSIFLEGLARPLAGVQLILKMLVRRFKELGGELRLRAAVEKIAVEGERGAKSRARGRRGTRNPQRPLLGRLDGDHALVRRQSPRRAERRWGRLSLVESISILDVQPRTLGYGKTIVFYNDSDTFHYEKPEGLVDLRSGTICSPNNFAYYGAAHRRQHAHSALANYDGWAALKPRRLSPGEAPLLRSDRGRGGAVRARLSRLGHRNRPLYAADDSSFYGSCRRGRVWLGLQAARRHHAPEESLHLRQRPGTRRHRGHDHQRHQYRQPVLVEVSPDCPVNWCRRGVDALSASPYNAGMKTLTIECPDGLADRLERLVRGVGSR